MTCFWSTRFYNRKNYVFFNLKILYIYFRMIIASIQGTNTLFCVIGVFLSMNYIFIVVADLGGGCPKNYYTFMFSLRSPKVTLPLPPPAFSKILDPPLNSILCLFVIRFHQQKFNSHSVKDISLYHYLKRPTSSYINMSSMKLVIPLHCIS